MQALTNKRHDAFAREIAATGRKPVDVYLDLYETTNRANAQKRSWDLMQKQEIKDRITFIVNMSVKAEAQSVMADRRWIEREMIDLYMNARKNGDRTNAVKALQLMGQDIGMYVQRKAVLHGKMDPLEGTKEDVVRRISSQIARSFPGSDPTAILRLLTGGGASGASGEAEASEVPALSAVPEAERVSSSWSDVPEAVPDGGEPGGEDLGGKHGDGIPSHWPLS